MNELKSKFNIVSIVALIAAAVLLITLVVGAVFFIKANDELSRFKKIEDEYAKNLENAFSDSNKIPYDGLDPEDIDGAASVEREGDVYDSPYYKTTDFYNMKSNETLTILENFKTIQQYTEWTCGPTSALMVLEWFGMREGQNEMDLVALRHKPAGGATNLRQMIYIFEELNAKYKTQSKDFEWDIYSTYEYSNKDRGYAPEAKERGRAPSEEFIVNSLKDGVPVIIGDNEWGGHWYVVIGYDNMGTTEGDTATADDVLIVADPYDTTDHCQDGYTIVSFERLYYNWKNNFDPVFSQYIFLTVKPKSVA